MGVLADWGARSPFALVCGIPAHRMGGMGCWPPREPVFAWPYLICMPHPGALLRLYALELPAAFHPLLHPSLRPKYPFRTRSGAASRSRRLRRVASPRLASHSAARRCSERTRSARSRQPGRLSFSRLKSRCSHRSRQACSPQPAREGPMPTRRPARGIGGSRNTDRYDPHRYLHNTFVLVLPSSRAIWP